MSDVDVILNILFMCSYLGPISYILNDNRTQGQEKNGWLVASIFFSWFAWLAYIAIVPQQIRQKLQQAKQREIKQDPDDAILTDEFILLDSNPQPESVPVPVQNPAR